MDTQPPKPILVAQLTPAEQAKLDELHRNRFNKPAQIEPLKIENCGAIKNMLLGPDWKDLGTWPRSNNLRDKSHGGNRFFHRNYRIIPNNGTLRIPYYSTPQSDQRAAKTKSIVDSIKGEVPKDKWSELNGLFGSAAMSNDFIIHSVKIDELGGKRVVEMTGVLNSTGTREKNIYVSLSGDWTQYYEFGIGVKNEMVLEESIAKFDKALKSVVWKAE